MSVAGGLLADLNWAPALVRASVVVSENISDIYILIRTYHYWHVSEFIHYLSTYMHTSLHRHTYTECDTWWAPCRDKWRADAQSRGTLYPSPFRCKILSTLSFCLSASCCFPLYLFVYPPYSLFPCIFTCVCEFVCVDLHVLHAQTWTLGIRTHIKCKSTGE
jgi:hypothetical protein